MAIPTVSKTVLSITLTFSGIVAFVWGFDLTFADVDPVVRRKLGQTGLLLAYAGFLLGLYKFFWHPKVIKHRRETEQAIQAAQSNIHLLRRLSSDLGKDLASHIAEHEKKIAAHMLDMETIASQETVQKLQGWASVAAVVVGTFMQFMSLG